MLCSDDLTGNSHAVFGRSHGQSDRDAIEEFIAVISQRRENFVAVSTSDFDPLST
jgi:hypothetical protein